MNGHAKCNVTYQKGLRVEYSTATRCLRNDLINLVGEKEQHYISFRHGNS